MGIALAAAAMMRDGRQQGGGGSIHKSPKDKYSIATGTHVSERVSSQKDLRTERSSCSWWSGFEPYVMIDLEAFENGDGAFGAKILEQPHLSTWSTSS